MAISVNNPLTRGLSGMFGNLVVFRNIRGKTIMANRPCKPRKQSELQRENRMRFREATVFAKAAIQDVQKKEYYRNKARNMKLPNAYTAAITDYMRRPVGREITVQSEARSQKSEDPRKEANPAHSCGEVRSPPSRDARGQQAKQARSSWLEARSLKLEA